MLNLRPDFVGHNNSFERKTMSKRRHGLKPNVERLQGKGLCSGLLPGKSANELTALAVINKTVSLHGTLRGDLQSEVGIPDTGRTFLPTGSGFLAGLGRASVAGNLQTTGFIARGRATGTRTLTLAKGTITLQLTGTAVQGGFAGLPIHFNFTITSGTGRYRNVTDHGIATLTTTPQGGGTQSNVTEQGAFTLKLSSSNTKIAAPVI
jgi:hypothetical protein